MLHGVASEWLNRPAPRWEGRMHEALGAVPFFCGVLKSKQHKGAATHPPT